MIAIPYLPTTLMLVEEDESGDAVDDISTFVHDNDGSRPQATLDSH